jgi:hypothetical protein
MSIREDVIFMGGCHNFHGVCESTSGEDNGFD